MHHSRVGVVLIDLPAEAYDAAAQFWANARGGDRDPEAGPTGDDPYEVLPALPGGVEFALQLTGDGTPPRLHLDIETDDVTAEIDRLIELGASVYERRESYAIMQDPAGLLFCVVPVQTGADFAPNATAWN